MMRRRREPSPGPPGPPGEAMLRWAVDGYTWDVPAKPKPPCCTAGRVAELARDHDIPVGTTVTCETCGFGWVVMPAPPPKD